jgi:hypothetical protein
MRAELKEIYSLEVDCDLDKYWPEDPENFGVSMRLMVGVENAIGAESFDIFVCTPDWLKDHCRDDEAMSGRHMLIVCEYDFNLIKIQINRWLNSCTGNNWRTVAYKFSRFAAWEFEDYEESIESGSID